MTLLGVVPCPGALSNSGSMASPWAPPAAASSSHTTSTGAPRDLHPGGAGSPPKGCHPSLRDVGVRQGTHLPQQGCALLGLILEQDLKILEAFH